jgi:hypothetical protein
MRRNQRNSLFLEALEERELLSGMIIGSLAPSMTSSDPSAAAVYWRSSVTSYSTPGEPFSGMVVGSPAMASKDPSVAAVYQASSAADYSMPGEPLFGMVVGSPAQAMASGDPSAAAVYWTSSATGYPMPGQKAQDATPGNSFYEVAIKGTLGYLTDASDVENYAKIKSPTAEQLAQVGVTRAIQSVVVPSATLNQPNLIATQGRPTPAPVAPPAVAPGQGSSPQASSNEPVGEARPQQTEPHDVAFVLLEGGTSDKLETFDENAESLPRVSMTDGLLQLAPGVANLLIGRVPADMPALKQAVDDFFVGLTSLAEDMAAPPTLAGLTQWLMAAAALGSAVHFARRRLRNRSGPGAVEGGEDLLAATWPSLSGG